MLSEALRSIPFRTVVAYGGKYFSVFSPHELFESFEEARDRFILDRGTAVVFSITATGNSFVLRCSKWLCPRTVFFNVPPSFSFSGATESFVVNDEADIDLKEFIPSVILRRTRKMLNNYVCFEGTQL